VAWHHAIFPVAEAKQACRIGRGTRNCHTWKKRFPRHDIATRGILAIATRGVLAIAMRVVLAIATCGVV